MDSNFITYISNSEKGHQPVEELMNSRFVVHRTCPMTQGSDESSLKDYLPLIKEWKCERLTLGTILAKQVTNTN